MRRPRFNIMIVPEDAAAGDPVSWSVPGYFFRLLIAAGVFVILVLAGSIFFLVHTQQQRAALPILKADNERLERIAAQVPRLEMELEQYREFTAKIAALVGVSPPVFQEMNWPLDTSMIEIADSLRRQQTAEMPQLPSGGVAFDQAPLASAIETSDTTNYPMGLPMRGRLSRGFAPLNSNPAIRHFGIDIAAREGVPVCATAAGEIEFAGFDEELGFLVVIDHRNGFKTLYGHNDSLTVEAGAPIIRGAQIAISGNTGHSSAPHLHYEIRYGENALDPMLFIGAR